MAKVIGIIPILTKNNSHSYYAKTVNNTIKNRIMNDMNGIKQLTKRSLNNDKPQQTNTLENQKFYKSFFA